MSNTYHSLMKKQCLSTQAKACIYDKLLNRKEHRTQPILRWAVAVACCVLLLIPITAFAAESLFGISIVEIVKGNMHTGSKGIGYEVSHPDLVSYQLSDFPEEIQTMEDYRLVVYETWQDAEAELGITLADNPVLFDDSVRKDYTFRLEEKRIFQRAHCYATYNGKDGQFYRATIQAAYRYDNMHITLSSVVTCEHPAISKEKEYAMHGHGVWYRDHDVENIQQESYLAKNGINATIVTVDRVGAKSTDYEASFSAGGASYRITVRSYDKSRDVEAKEALIDILEGFVF